MSASVALIAAAAFVLWPIVFGRRETKPAATLDGIAARMAAAAARLPSGGDLVIPAASIAPGPGHPQSFDAALVALAIVRRRLLDTSDGGIDERTAAAVEIITSALVAGSDK